MITLVKMFLVCVMLVAMILVLLLISHLSHPEDSATNEENDRLRRDVETRDRVITSSSLFHQFFARESMRPRRK